MDVSSEGLLAFLASVNARHVVYKGGGASAERRKILLIGVREDEIHRLFPEAMLLHPDLQDQDLFLMDPSNPDDVTLASSAIPHLHVVRGQIPREGPLPAYPMFRPGMFDTIVVDFSTLKFMSTENLARFGQTYLKRKEDYGRWDGVFVRDMASSEYEYEVVNLQEGRPLGRDVAVVHGTESIRVQLNDRWTTRHYLTFLGVAGRHTHAVYLTKRLGPDANWSEAIPATDRDPRVHLRVTLGRQSMHGVIEVFAKHDLLCFPTQAYPLAHARSQGLDEKLECRFFRA